MWYHSHAFDLKETDTIMDDAPLTAQAILSDLDTAGLPRSVHCFTQVSSTMDVAREWLQNAPLDSFPALILAEAQTSGRGRQGRSWATPPGSALLFSLIFKPHWLPMSRAYTLVWLAGVSLCEGIQAATGLEARLKWPNDVLLPASGHDQAENQSAPGQPTGLHHDSRYWHKAAGILLEMSSTGQMIDYAIIGCGLNVNASPPVDMPLRYGATDLAATLGHSVARLPLLRAILTRMDHWHTYLQGGAYEHLFQAWRNHLLTLGQDVRIETATGVLTGHAEDVDRSGILYVRDATGQIHSISSGDVGLIEPAE